MYRTIESQTRTMTLNALVEMLTDRLQSIVPGSVRLQADLGTIIVHSRHGPTLIPFGVMFRAMIDDGRTVADSLENAALNTLDQLQDIIVREERMPWPRVPEARSAMPGSFVQIKDDQLYLSYATPEVDVTAIVSLPIHGLTLDDPENSL
jgi:hypothetical protein